MQSLKNRMAQAVSDDEQTHSGNFFLAAAPPRAVWRRTAGGAETGRDGPNCGGTHVAVPEKGILKKTYGSVVPMDGGEDSTSDNQEVLSQSDNLLSSEV